MNVDEFLKYYIDSIDRQVNDLNKIRFNTILQLVKGCKHEQIVTTENNGRWPWKSTEYVTCINCGIRVTGCNCGVIHAPLLDLTNSRIVSLKPNEKVECRLFIDVELATALRFPRRFTPKRLKELMAQTPWTFEEVRMKDQGQNYSILTDLYDNHDMWYNDTYVRD